ncbi:class I SAM-dependent methyltransferase [Planctomyces sp. SH-PL62]|uniref:class I SAM-dependent methyltransferase n=1 Tax=Planctomyces sp. SH-PL62 TaxID=1636152 RepID=UPI00078E6146|nr:class I SAM-dependent methyltransferase [Planctomyces sp. SH-PL62]AMV37173.1 Demethylmenaquinone methyltransferase [Planctomyces sp. SH-PL62]
MAGYRRSIRLLRSATAGLVGVTLALAGSTTAAQGTPQEGKGPKTRVDPKINDQFQKPGHAKGFIERFESHDREVFAKRDAIVASLGLKPGMAVADVGAGSGLFTRLFAEKVGPEGRVFAVDVSKEFLRHIAAESEKNGRKQVKTVLGSQDSTNLEANSVDLVFLSDVYHHFEDHEKMLASIRQALRPGGTLILIEFDRVEGKSSEFVLKHVRAGQAEFLREIEAAGFTLDAKGARPQLVENFFARFHKPDAPVAP